MGTLIMPEHAGKRGADVWRHLDDAGFAHGWTFDHLSWRTLRDGPWFDAMTTLAAAAMVTSRMALGTLVSNPNFRHPVVLAKEAMTLDHLSAGRLVLGLGGGAQGPDNAAIGDRHDRSPAERCARFQEFVELTDRLLRHPVTHHSGEFYQVEDARMIPGCVRNPRLPFAVAAAGVRAMRVAAEHGQWWVTNGPVHGAEQLGEERFFEVLAQQIGRFRDVCAEAGRPFGDVRRLVYLSRALPHLADSPQNLVDVLSRCAELGFTDAVVAYPRSTGIFSGDPRHLQSVAADIASHKSD
ncbi:LLM class flavin-dependent oxidoreductase [Couchioplanes caeruleus]|uniref:LLM class flavin-dependent oxidoreductase n=1 Tax=Couchioplanes caeruleus TaxID=56438 RepID=UPI001B85CE0F|nr:LLM class flavin-dependent oxidoreductase [Couchioplanes caeruleus]